MKLARLWFVLAGVVIVAFGALFALFGKGAAALIGLGVIAVGVAQFIAARHLSDRRVVLFAWWVGP